MMHRPAQFERVLIAADRDARAGIDRRTMLEIRTMPENEFGTIERFWSDPAFRAEINAEREVRQAAINAPLDAKRDAALRKLGYL